MDQFREGERNSDSLFSKLPTLEDVRREDGDSTRLALEPLPMFNVRKYELEAISDSFRKDLDLRQTLCDISNNNNDLKENKVDPFGAKGSFFTELQLPDMFENRKKFETTIKRPAFTSFYDDVSRVPEASNKPDSLRFLETNGDNVFGDGFNKTFVSNLTALAEINAGLQQPDYNRLNRAPRPVRSPNPSSMTPAFQGYNSLDARKEGGGADVNNTLIMRVRSKFGQLGAATGMFNSPHGFCLSGFGDIIVADTYNHRIQVFDKIGTPLYCFGTAGKENGLLWYPRKITAMPTSGNLIVCDRGDQRSRMQVFTPFGFFLRRIEIRFIDIVAGLAINRDNNIVAVDSVTPTVFVLSESGTLLQFIECGDFMQEPSDIAVFEDEYYICDFKGYGVVVLHESGTFLRRIGCEEVTRFPNGIDVSHDGDVIVGDSHGNQFHVAIYSKKGILRAQYICPQIKVSRCCGLKITSNGHVVTLAKNNHHVLVLDTLYIL